MREIKFRAWDLDTQDRMYSWDEIKLHFNEHLEHERVVTMQFTGLKDKNGKEIYEGDLIKKKFKDREIGEFYAIGEVVYGYWYAGFTVPYNYHGYKKLERLSNSFDKDGWVVANRDMEVIGNIYENPELIKD
ncbi:YopX family protein [Cytobacillus sp. FSL W8-0315]|uniref:YopX family protein n=1 Tax=Cytobacillus sp. FSL W8-0315 TaxID=2921600 RepID=UPI0030F5C295